MRGARAFPPPSQPIVAVLPRRIHNLISSEMSYFPYMVFARGRAQVARHNLTGSGMPTPAGFEVLAQSLATDIGFAGSMALPTFEAAVAERLGVAPKRVIATLGATGGMHLAAWRFFRPGSRVASETPSYEPLRALPRAFGAECVPLERDPTDSWRIDPARLRRALTGARPGHVFITNSHNPTGTLLAAGEIVALAAEAERAGGVLVCCEVYMEFAGPRSRTPAFRLAPNAISISSMTKAYGLGGLRAGWMVLGEGLANERESLLDLAYLTYVDQPTQALHAGVKAMELLESLRAPIETVQRESRPAFLSWLASTPGLSASEPDLGITAFARIEGIEDTVALAEHLLERWDVGVVPGEFFGRPGHLRLGFGLPREALSVALDRLGKGIAEFNGRAPRAT